MTGRRLLVWRDSAHWSPDPGRCDTCGQPTHLLNDAGQFQHKVCAERALDRQPAPEPAAGRRRVLVTGSGSWTDRTAIRTAMADLERWAGPLRPVLVTGACPHGAGRIAEQIATERGWPIEHHPDQQQHGPAAGPQRAAALVATRPDACIAFIRDHSPDATHARDLATAAGIPTKTWTDDRQAVLQHEQERLL